MALDPGFLGELKQRVSLPELVGRHVKLARRGREYAGLCPFHTEKTPSFNVVPDKGFWHCHGCGAHGDAIGFVERTENLDFVEAVERLARLAGIEVPQQTEEDRQRAKRQKALLEAYAEAADFYERQLWDHDFGGGGAARRYLTDRGLDPETIRRWRLGWAGDDRDALGRVLKGFPVALLVEGGLLHTSQYQAGAPFDFFQNRVIFPIGDRLGRVIAFGGRVLGDGQPKYLNSPEHPLFDKGRTLYGNSLARGNLAREEAAPGGAIVAEGYMDVIALHRSGFGGAVAPLGTALTEAHLAELWRLDPEPALCFDGDKAGQRASIRALHRALPLLKPGHSLRFVTLPSGEDPDTLISRGAGRQAFEEHLHAAAPLSEMLWRSVSGDAQLDTPERRAGFSHRVMSLVSGISDDAVRSEYRRFLRAKLKALSAWSSAHSLLPADPLDAIEAGKDADPLSREAFAFWRRRWWRGEEGRNQRVADYAFAAFCQVEPDDIRLSAMPLGAARGITAKAGGHWHTGEPKRDDWLATLPLFERVENALLAIDILAWYPDDPLKWWTRTGALRVLGEHRLSEALKHGKPVRVYQTPFAWNEAGAGGAPGCCILDWESSEGLECRVFARALIADGEAHARELQKMVDRRKPKIQFVITGGRA